MSTIYSVLLGITYLYISFLILTEILRVQKIVFLSEIRKLRLETRLK